MLRARGDVLEHFNPFTSERRFHVDETGDVTTGVWKPFDEPAPNWIGDDNEHDRDGLGLTLERRHGLGSLAQDHIGLQRHEFFRKVLHPTDIGLPPPDIGPTADSCTAANCIVIRSPRRRGRAAQPAR